MHSRVGLYTPPNKPCRGLRGFWFPCPIDFHVTRGIALADDRQCFQALGIGAGYLGGGIGALGCMRIAGCGFFAFEITGFKLDFNGKFALGGVGMMVVMMV